MTTGRSTRPWGLIAAVGAVGVLAGALAMFAARPNPGAPGAQDAPTTPAPAGGPAPAALTITPEAAARAGVQTGVATEGAASRTMRLPGHVEANGYSQVVITATTAGRVTAMSVELGDRARKGQVLGQLFAPEVADQQRVYLSMRAELEAAHAKLARTERLVALGSVSKQELEATRAEHTTHATDVEGARARLGLLGVSSERLAQLTSADQISAIADIVAPSAGSVIRRAVNVGQNVEAGADLVALADLSSVWVVADVFERDLAQVGVGTPVSITSAAFPGATWRSRVSYVDPQLVPETRTVRVRADVPNGDARLKLGQYVEVSVEGRDARRAVFVPKAAVQTIGDRQFVYVPDPARADQFLEREIMAGAIADDTVEVQSGIAAGERVVTSGSFFLRAERDRLGLPLPAPMTPPASPSGSVTQTPPKSPARRYEIAVTEQGFEPSRVDVPANEVIELRFTRKTDKTCATAVAIPSLDLKKDLPLNAVVAITLPARAKGEIAFVCGMNMLRGTVVVK
jgi:RND family efflux transporter MFP subunit